MYRQAMMQYQALCFGKPIGPWRYDREKAREDLIERRLGGYDEWGKFWITVPGDLDRRYTIEEIDEAA